ncbi:DUF2845 domain-containing protein [Pseudomonas aeruginosa]
MLRNISIGVLLAMAAMLDSYGVAAATLRCGSAIVSEGDLIDDVLRKCGNPDSRKVEGPAVDGSGYMVRGGGCYCRKLGIRTKEWLVPEA